MEETIVRHIGRDDARPARGADRHRGIAKVAAPAAVAIQLPDERDHHGADARGARAAVLGGLHARRAWVHALSLSVFTSLPPDANEAGGGFGNAIAGTLVMVAIASAH